MTQKRTGILSPRKTREEELSRLIRICGHRLYHASPGSRSQAAVLFALEAAGPASQKELQNKLTVSSASITELINKLEKQGLVLRTRDEKDRRRVLLTLTPAGFAKAAHFRAHGQNPVCYAMLTEEELERVTLLMRKIAGQWQENSPVPESRTDRQEVPV